MEQVSDNFLTQVLDVFSKFNSTLTRVRKGKLIKVIIYMQAINLKKKKSSDFFLKLCFEFQLGSTAIGIQTNEGVVLAVEKRVTSPLIEPSSIEKILEVDEHIG